MSEFYSKSDFNNLYEYNNGKSLIFEDIMQGELLSLNHRGSGRTIKVDCPFCKGKLKGTLWRGDEKDIWWYSCWRASCTYSKGAIATNWLKEVSPIGYQNYLNRCKDLFKELNSPHKDPDHVELIKSKIQENIKMRLAARAKREAEEAKKKQMNELTQVDNFLPMETGSGPLYQSAVEFCKKRKIPEEIWRKFYYVENGKYRNRIVIPFYRRNGSISFFQARSLDPNSEIKYLSSLKKKEIYNMDFVDKSKPIIVLEGPIDSMFVENSIATVGISSSKEINSMLGNSSLKVYYLYDNDKAGRISAYLKVLEGYPVFSWNRFLFESNLPANVKDINDVVCSSKYIKFSTDQLIPYFTTSPIEYLEIDIKPHPQEYYTIKKEYKRKMQSRKPIDYSKCEVEREAIEDF